MKKLMRSILASALALGTVASVSTGVIGVPVYAATAAVADSEASPNDVTVSDNAMYNDYIKLVINPSMGRFVIGTTGGNPDSTTDNDKKLLYGFPGIGTGTSHTYSNGSSFTTVVIDDEEYKYGYDGMATAPEFSAAKKRNVSSVKYDKIKVTQTLSFVNNVSTGRDDVVEIKYTITNNDTVAHNVGTRIMMDTMLGSNDNAPFRAAGREITTETEFSGSAIPQYWQAFDSLTSPTVVSQGSFFRDAESGNAPDKVQFTNWSNVFHDDWDYAVAEDSNNGDSAVSVIWNQKKLGAGSSRTYTTYYGLSELTQDVSGELAVSLYSDATVSYNNIDESGNPIYNNLAVTAYVQNTGDGALENVKARIITPSGMAIADGTKSVEIGTLEAGSVKQLTWNVKVAGNTPAGSYPLKVAVSADGVEEKTVSRNVKVPEILVNKSTISAETVKLGESTTVKCAASGGSGSYTYAVYYKKTTDTNWATKQDYSTEKTVEIKPSKETNYEICVKVKDSNGNIVKKYFTLSVGSELKNLTTLSDNRINLGKTITVKSNAEGGKAPYTYAVYLKKTDAEKWTVVQDFNNTAETAVKPAEAGTYQICSKVKDASGTIAKEYFDITVDNGLVNKSKVSATKINVGDTVKITCNAEGGTAPYKYAVYYKKTTDTKWAIAQEFSTNTKVDVKPGKAAKYDICVKVKDKTGTIEKKYFVVTAEQALTNKSVVTYGDKLNVKGAAKGGSGEYSYAVFYRRAIDTEWTKAQDFKAEADVTIKIKKGEAYIVCVKVKDSKGATDKGYYSVLVLDED